MTFCALYWPVVTIMPRFAQHTVGATIVPIYPLLFNIQSGCDISICTAVVNCRFSCVLNIFTVLEQVMKTSASSLAELNTTKNLIGSAMAGSLGGFNAHAANIVSAMFIATGQVSIQPLLSSIIKGWSLRNAWNVMSVTWSIIRMSLLWTNGIRMCHHKTSQLAFRHSLSSPLYYLTYNLKLGMVTLWGYWTKLCDDSL